MKCSMCGAEIKEGDKFCTKCGQAVVPTKTNSNVNETNKKPNIGLIIGIVALVIVAALAILLVIGLKEEKSVKKASNEPVINNNNEKTGKNETPKTIEFNGYTFTVPASSKASVSGDKLYVYGPGSKWVGVVMTQEGDYNTLVTMKDQIKTALSAQEGAEDYDMSKAVTEEKEYGGKPFLITKNIGSGNYNLDISYGKADDNNIYIISITKSNGTELSESERAEMYGIVASGQKQA